MSRTSSPIRRGSSESELHDHRFQAHSLPRHNEVLTVETHHQAGGHSRAPSSAQSDNRAAIEEFDQAMRRARGRRDSDGSDGMMVGNVVLEDTDEEDTGVSDLQEITRLQRRPSVAEVSAGRARGVSNAARRVPIPALVLPGRHDLGRRSPSPPNSMEAFAINRSPGVAFPDRDAESRSPSPPNSVDAFASNRRHHRSGTVSSQVPSELASLRRQVSRRMSDDNNSGEHVNSGDEANTQAEDDVCFPMAADPNRFKIDFEELEDFAQHHHLGNLPRPAQRKRKMSTCSTVNNNFSRSTSVQKYPSFGTEEEDNDTCAIAEDEAEDGNDTDFISEKQKPRVKKPSNPDRFSFFSSELDATVHAPEFGDLTIEGEKFSDLFTSGVWWLDIVNPTDEEMKMLARAFSLHPLTAEDIRVQETREKVELFKSYYFVCFRSFVQKRTAEDFMEPINIYVVVFREGVLSFQFTSSPHSANVRRRIRQLRDYVALSSDWICYALIDDITDSFGPVIHDIEQETDAIEDAVFVARNEDFSQMLKQIGACRKKVMGLLRLLGGKADVIKGFAKKCNENYLVTPRGEIGLYLGDIQDHIVTMSSNLGHFEKMLSRSHSNYLAQLSVDHMESNNRINDVLSKITIIATVLVPMNLICGLFGMNVKVPGWDVQNLHWFYGIIGVIGGFLMLSMIVARRLRFI